MATVKAGSYLRIRVARDADLIEFYQLSMGNDRTNISWNKWILE